MRNHLPLSFRNRLITTLLLPASISLLIASCARQEGTGTVSISNFFPTGETSRFTNITIEFSKAVAEQDSVNVLLDSAPVEFTPDAAGRFRWIDTHTLRFLPTEAFSPATDYSVRIRPQITEAICNAGIGGKREMGAAR